jgi:predicted ATP-grasp superfamily ATP-dependent carboligase
MSDGNEELIQVVGWPDQLRRPVLVLGMEGWIDAGLGGGAAVATLLEEMTTEHFATFDSDALIDQRARRPVLRVVNGINAGLTWPEITMRWAVNGDRSVIILSGPEPDIRWKQFTRDVVSISMRLGVELVVGLGAFPAPVPHTRPVSLVATATTKELADQVGYLPASIDVPAGIQASLEQAFAQVGVPAVGIWARVPHYAAGMPYPTASEALLDKLTELTGIAVDTTSLHQAAVTALEQLDRLISGSVEHSAMVHQLEQQHDDESNIGVAFDLSDMNNLPSGEEIAAELERFLRGDEQS